MSSMTTSTNPMFTNQLTPPPARYVKERAGVRAVAIMITVVIA